MKLPIRLRHGKHEQTVTHEGEPAPGQLAYGAGLWTAHPVGLLIVVGLLVMGLIGLPEFRWFFSASLVLGGVFGFIPWRLHR